MRCMGNGRSSIHDAPQTTALQRQHRDRNHGGDTHRRCPLSRYKDSYSGRDWSELSSDCKETLRTLLKKKPKERPSAFEALQSKWLQAANAELKKEAIDDTLTRMQDFGVKYGLFSLETDCKLLSIPTPSRNY